MKTIQKSNLQVIGKTVASLLLPVASNYDLNHNDNGKLWSHNADRGVQGRTDGR